MGGQKALDCKQPVIGLLQLLFYICLHSIPDVTVLLPGQVLPLLERACWIPICFREAQPQHEMAASRTLISFVIHPEPDLSMALKS
jgi:hypothetical protein